MVLALTAVLLATGCATVPTAGQIRSTSQDGPIPVGNRAGLGVEAQGPRHNAKPMAIVTGFLDAMSELRTYDVARQYMTPEAAAAWQPDKRVYVYRQDGPRPVTPGPKGTYQLKAPLIGTIDQRGSWTQASRTATVTFDFRLVQSDGQYRVANVPPGAFLGTNLVESRLKQNTLYFLNRDRTLLVPDPIVGPSALPAGQEATQLIQELLRGPTDRLGNGVTTAAPPGTQVNVSVPVDEGVATVALSDEAADLNPTDRRLLAAQILWTLRPISTKVRITVGGAQLLTDSPDILPFSEFAEYDPSVGIAQMKSLYGVRAGKVVRINLEGSEEIVPEPLSDSRLSLYAAKSFAVNLRGDVGATVTRVQGRDVVAVAPLDPSDQDDGWDTEPADGTVLRPSFDNQGNLWILDRANGPSPRLRVRAEDGTVTEVRTDFKGATPVTLRMAPDGVRALLVLRRNGQNAVYTATVTTDRQQRLALSLLRPLEVPLLDITDASWHPQGVLVAGRPKPGVAPEPWLVNPDGSQPQPIPGVSAEFDADKVASNTNIDTLTVVQDSKGRLHWQTKDLGWTALEDDGPVRIDPVYPG